MPSISQTPLSGAMGASFPFRPLHIRVQAWVIVYCSEWLSLASRDRTTQIRLVLLSSGYLPSTERRREIQGAECRARGRTTVDVREKSEKRIYELSSGEWHVRTRPETLRPTTLPQTTTIALSHSSTLPSSYIHIHSSKPKFLYSAFRFVPQR